MFQKKTENVLCLLNKVEECLIGHYQQRIYFV